VLDQLQWCWSANGVYSSCSAYAVLLSEQAAVPLTNVGSFVASAPAEMLDRDHRCHRELQVDNSCALCSQEPELIDHLMVRCLFSREVWFLALWHGGWESMAPIAESSFVAWWVEGRKHVVKERRNVF
jgi:hypothetical protein